MSVPKVLEPRCKVCKSPNRAEYERIANQMLQEKYKIDYKELREIALRKFKENISIASFKRHFEQGHVQTVDEYLEAKARKKIEQMKKARVKIPVDVLSELINNLELARQLTTLLVTQMQSIQPADPKELSMLMNSLRGMLSEIRQTLKQVHELSKRLKLPSQYSREELIYEIAKILSELNLPELRKAKARLLLYITR